MRLSIPKFVLGSILSCAWACACFAQPKKVVKNESELPRFTYKVTGNVADLLKPDSAAFKHLSVQVKADLDSILKNYQVEDKSTERELLGARLSFEEMAGQNDQALRTIDTIRGLEEKPDAKLTADLIDRAIVEARIDAKATSGAAYDSAFTRRLSEAVNQLPWN